MAQRRQRKTHDVHDPTTGKSLTRIADGNSKDFALLMTLEMGKPLAEARGEVAYVCANSPSPGPAPEFTAKLAVRIGAPTVGRGTVAGSLRMSQQRTVQKW